MFVSLLLTPALAADVLILWDTTERGVPAIQTALTTAGHTVTLSDTIQYEFNGTNPSLDGFDVVVHLNGDTYANDMDEAGQQALVDFVAAGGGFLHQEWNAYTHDEAGLYTLMEDLTLLVRGGATNMESWAVVAGQEGHPVVAGGGFEMTAVGNLGLARVYEEDPSVVLMTSGDYDAVVAREWQEGRIVGLAVAGSWNGQDPYNEGMLALVTNAVGWLGDCDRDDDGFERAFCDGDDCDDADHKQGGPSTLYEDADGDGYGDAAMAFCGDPGNGWAEVDGDCDDGDAAAFPGATEEPWDGIDQDCDGSDLCDADEDGEDADVGDCGGDDCDDEDDTVGPDADEVLDDGVDQDCDGEDDVSTDDDGDDGDSADTGDATARGCGCDTGNGAAGLGAGLLAAALLRRRR